jgi:hypothetical protein
MWTYFIPLYVLAALLLLFGLFVLLGRIRGGRYLRPIVAVITRVPFLKRLLMRASKAALERQNPDLAGAMRKLEQAGADRDPRRAQVAMSRMTAAERRAWIAHAESQGTIPVGSNRAERRRLEKIRRQAGR